MVANLPGHQKPALLQEFGVVTDLSRLIHALGDAVSRENLAQHVSVGDAAVPTSPFAHCRQSAPKYVAGGSPPMEVLISPCITT